MRERLPATRVPVDERTMTILFTGRKADLTPDLKQFAERKLSKLGRLLGDGLDIHVIITLEKHRHLVEIVAKARMATLTARADAAEFIDSMGLCIDRLLVQARKRHGRMAEERKRRARRSSPRRPGSSLPPTLPAGSGSPEDERPLVVPMGRVPVKPMSVEEALLMMRDSPDPFMVFRNAQSQQISVIFRRDDGQFGLIEPEA